MTNRISKYLNNGKKKKESENIEDIRTFFLACEFKPGAVFWNIIEPFAYDVKPAFIYGSLGIMAYEPASYSIVEATEECQPLMGYTMTITHDDSIMLLDRTKGYFGNDSFNLHIRKLVPAYTDVDEVTNAWFYLLSTNVLNAYQSIETIEFGMWDENESQLALLDKILER